MKNIDYRKQCHELLDIMSSYGISLWITDVKTGERINVDRMGAYPIIADHTDYEKYIHPQDVLPLQYLIDDIRKGAKQSGHVHIRAQVASDSEEFHYLDIFCKALFGDDGEMIYIASAAMDITEDIIYKEKLNINEERLRLLLKARDTIQYEYDVEKDVIYVENDPFFPGRHIIPLTDYEGLLDPENRTYEPVRKLRLGLDEVINVEWRMKNDYDREWSYMSFTNIPIQKNTKGKVVKYSGLRRDNTPTLRLMRKVEESNALFSTVIDRLPCLFFMKDVDDDFRYTIANAMFCRALGRNKNEVEGFTDYQMFHAREEADKFRFDDMEAVECENKSIIEETNWAEGRKVWHTVKYLLVTTAGKRYLLGMSIDITQLQDAMEELKVAKDKAEMADKLKSSFLANMSHEIRTPLNSILGFSQLLVSTDDQEEKDNYGNIVASNGAQLLRIINDVLDLSKIEAGYLKLNKKPIDLAKVMEEVEQSFSPKMNKNVKLMIDSPYPKYIVQADKDRLFQVINNFVSNSIKHTKEGYIKVGYGSFENGTKIYVEDTGCGISKENHSKVFGRFNKLDSFSQGTGLGLSICKIIAESSGGRVGFTSDEGKGSTFWCYFPTEIEL